MSKKKFYLGVVIGRFQPVHLGHKEVLRAAMMQCEHLLVLAGSVNRPLSPKNPFTFQQRKVLIDLTTAEKDMPEVGSVTVAPLNDNFLDSVWTTDVRRNVDRALKSAMCIDGETGKVALFGHNKDESSYYLNEFPEWEAVEVPNVRDLNAADIRRNLFDIYRPTDHTFLRRIEKYAKKHMPMIAEELTRNLSGFLAAAIGGQGLPFIDTPEARQACSEAFREVDLYAIKTDVPEPVYAFLQRYVKSEEYLTQCLETQFYKSYDMSWGLAPFPSLFVTTDAVVTWKGHVLLIKRKAHPGKGQWALPGGFLEHTITIRRNIIKELREETRIAVPNHLLDKCIVDIDVFEDPRRSLRGRIITHAGHVVLDNILDVLPEVRGDDDAEQARWFTYAEILDCMDQLFDDHSDIIKRFVFNAK